MFPLLGVAPALGRTFLPDDFQNGKDQVVVLSYRLWERRFARDPAILGQKLLLDGAPYTVIGVMPPRFHFSPFWITRAEMWLRKIWRTARAIEVGNHYARLRG